MTSFLNALLLFKLKSIVIVVVVVIVVVIIIVVIIVDAGVAGIAVDVVVLGGCVVVGV